MTRPANQKEIGVFVKAAVARYAEHGVKEDEAVKRLDGQLRKYAELMRKRAVADVVSKAVGKIKKRKTDG